MHRDYIKESDFSWYKLINVKGLGSKSLLIIYRVLVKESMSVIEIFNLTETDFYFLFKEFGKGHYTKIKYENFHNLDEKKLYDAYKILRENNIVLVSVQDKKYPNTIKKRLKVDSPPILYLKGNINLLQSPSISIVGSRNADEEKLIITKNIASFFASKNYNVVSGYAKGVDTSAHLGALENEGSTSVILPQGMNYLSIKRNFKKYNLKDKTLFVSQFLPEEKWRGSNAMKRNKIVTALSDAVIVISSGPEVDDKGRMSGTFDAGKSALIMNIPVFVLSPNLFVEPPKGNIKLIELGAIEFVNKEDILSELIKIPKDENGITRFENNIQSKQLKIK